MTAPCFLPRSMKQEAAIKTLSSLPAPCFPLLAASFTFPLLAPLDTALASVGSVNLYIIEGKIAGPGSEGAVSQSKVQQDAYLFLLEYPGRLLFDLFPQNRGAIFKYTKVFEEKAHPFGNQFNAGPSGGRDYPAPVLGEQVEQKASRIFKQKEIRVRLDLGLGDGSFTAWTCDFSFDYVKINASYRS